MRYFIGLDGGGTKIDAVLFDENGHIINRYVGKGGNATDVGKEVALQRLDVCINQILQDFPGKITAIYGGMAGVVPNGDFYSGHIDPLFSESKNRFEDDGCILISGGIGCRDGCGMVCGTGSSLFIRISGQPLRHIGGKGYLIDTGGSGFDLGQQAIRKALQSVDGRIGKTVLTDLLADIIGMPINDYVIPVVHAGGRIFIASFAKAVFDGCKLNDLVCQEIFDAGSSQLADLTFVAEKYFSGLFPIVIAGGIATAYPEYVEAVKKKSSERAQFMVLDAPPVYGAAIEAMANAGINPPDSFKETFLSDYSELSR